MATKLMEEILNKENLERACRAVMSNKGSSGVDWMKVEDCTKQRKMLSQIRYAQMDGTQKRQLQKRMYGNSKRSASKCPQ